MLLFLIIRKIHLVFKKNIINKLFNKIQNKNNNDSKENYVIIIYPY